MTDVTFLYSNQKFTLRINSDYFPKLFEPYNGNM